MDGVIWWDLIFYSGIYVYFLITLTFYLLAIYNFIFPRRHPIHTGHMFILVFTVCHAASQEHMFISWRFFAFTQL
jgi:hypothetical protein